MFALFATHRFTVPKAMKQAMKKVAKQAMKKAAAPAPKATKDFVFFVF